MLQPCAEKIPACFATSSRPTHEPLTVHSATARTPLAGCGARAVESSLSGSLEANVPGTAAHDSEAMS